MVRDKMSYKKKSQRILEGTMRLKNNLGYTLIELMVVVAIIGILGAIAIPGYIGYRLRAERSVVWTDLQSIRLLEEQFYAENNNYVDNCANAAAITAALPGFSPDQDIITLYTYSIGAVGANPQTFTASAARIAGTGNDPGSPWTIDQANPRNF